MTTEPTPTKQEHPNPTVMHQGGGSDAIFGSCSEKDIIKLPGR